MRCHWESQTRKLNKHYQSAGRVSAPLWGMCLLNCGGVATQSGYDYGLTFDKDGIHLGGFSSGGGKAQVVIGSMSIANLQGTILPLWYIMCDNITIDGVVFPDLTGKTLSDSTGKLKWKYDNVTLTYTLSGETRTWQGRVVLVYIDLVDVPMQSQYVTQSMVFNNVHFNVPFRKEQTQPIRYGVANNNMYVYERDLSLYTTGTIFYDKMFNLNQQTGYAEPTPPAINCGITLAHTLVDGFGRDPFFGQYGVAIQNDVTQSLERYGLVYYQGTNNEAIYDNYGVWGTGLATLGIVGFHQIKITDNNGLYFDFMNVPTVDITGNLQTGSATQTSVIGWQ